MVIGELKMEKTGLASLPPINKDFHELSSNEVEIVLTHADAAKYRKPKNANGSRGRYYWAKLQMEYERRQKDWSI